MLSLLRYGYSYIGDDISLLQDHGPMQLLLGASVNIHVTDHTIEMFPELRTAGLGLLRQGAYRKSFHTEDVYPGSRGRSCEPAMILYLQVTNMSHSCLEPLAKSLALEALVRSEAYRHDTDTAAQEFQVLSKLGYRRLALQRTSPRWRSWPGMALMESSRASKSRRRSPGPSPGGNRRYRRLGRRRPSSV